MREKSLRSKLFLFVMGLMICSSILSVGMLWPEHTDRKNTAADH
jgi:hypothetical protein